MTFEFPYEKRVLGHALAESAAHFGDRIFLTTPSSRYTFTDAFEHSQAVARGLRRMGVRAGQTVAVMLDNSAEFIFSWLGIALLDAICVPVNTAYNGELLAYVIEDCDAEIAITSRKLAPALCQLPQQRQGRLSRLVLCGEGAWPATELDTVDWKDMLEHVGQIVVSAACPADTALLCYTSGTTGPSKGVQQTHSMPFQTMETFVNVVGMTQDDVLFAPLPLFHGMSRSMATLAALCLGTRVHLAERFSASAFWEDVRDAGATISITMFTIPPILKKRPPGATDRDHGLRVMFNAHHDLEFEERFGVRLVEAHGMTEVGLTIYTPFPERRYGSAGKVGKDWEAILVDDHDRPVPIGQAGELLLRPRTPDIMMQGYLNKAEATVKALRNLWFHTGDLMRADADGYFFYAGRMKERIRRRGENISAYEVEAVASNHPQLIECTALGVPGGDGEDEVYLVAVMRAPQCITPAQYHAWLTDHLPKFMVPRYIDFRTELPKTGSGKVELHTLAKTVPAPNAWDSLRRGDAKPDQSTES